MSLTLSPQMRLVAIVGVVLLLVAGGGVFVLGHRQPAAPNEPLLSAAELVKRARAAHRVPTHPATKAKSAHAKKAAPAHAHHRVHTRAHARAKAAAKAAPTAKAKPKLVPKTAPPQAQTPESSLYQNLPASLLSALTRSKLVVAVLVNPHAPDDQIAYTEAQAGAKAVGAGFVALNVLSQEDVAQITRTYGLIDDPAVLIFRRPGVMIGRLNGFADSAAVAQAVEDNAPSDVSPPPAPAVPATKAAPAAWVKQANGVCRHAAATARKLGLLDTLKNLPAIVDEEIVSFKKIHPPAAQASRYGLFVSTVQNAVALEKAKRKALAAGKATEAADDAAKERVAARRGTKLATSLGLTDCAK